MPKKSKTKKKGFVQKIIKQQQEPEKAEIRIDGADELYSEIRVENELQKDDGEKVKLKQGAPVEVTLEADEKDTTPKTE